MPNGQSWNHTALASQPIQARRDAIRACSWKRSCGCANRRPMARVAGRVRQVELGVQAVPTMGEGGCFLSHVQGIGRRLRLRIRDDPLPVIFNHLPGSGRHDRQGSPLGPGGKRGTQSQAIGRSRGGITTKILALTPSQRYKYRLPGSGCARQPG